MNRLLKLRHWLAFLLLINSVIASPAQSSELLDKGDSEQAHRDILRGYRQIAHYSYEASWHAAERLKTSIQALLASPSAQHLAQARKHWREAHRVYSLTEVFRFGNWIVDDWESSINPWPVDEGLLDYVNADYQASPTNPLARHNLVTTESIEVGGIQINTAHPDWAQLKFIHGGSDIEANVVLGYHAIEFMLWGQDLHRTTSGAGERPWTDYSTDPENCTSGANKSPLQHCQRRRQLLDIMIKHLYGQLGTMTLKWAGDSPVSYGLHLLNGDINEGLRRMLFGMIRLAGDEMAGERMEVALMSQAPEEEQDCFSDDSHQSHWYNAQGVRNIYYGQFQLAGYRNGQMYRAPNSLSQLANHKLPSLAKKLDIAFSRTDIALAAIRTSGEAGETFDLLIRPEHPSGTKLLNTAMEALHKQAELLEELGKILRLGGLNPQAPR